MAATVTMSIPVAEAEEVLNYSDPIDCRVFEFVVVPASGTISWTDAQVAASGRSYLGSPGRLATLDSQAVNNHVLAAFPTEIATYGQWIGAYSPTGSNNPSVGWFWDSGEPFVYSNFIQPGEPSGWSGNPPEGATLNGAVGWNDVPFYNPPSTTPIFGQRAYIVEYDIECPVGAPSDDVATPNDGLGECRTGFPEPNCFAQPYDTIDNLAYQGNGFAQPAVAKDRIGCCSTIHAPEFANDGFYGNGASWLAGASNSWVKVDLGCPATIESVRFGRDRTGNFDDRDPGQIRILVADTDVYANGDDANDASEYTLVFDSAGSGYSGLIVGDQTLKASFAPTVGRYLKFEVTNGGAAIDELEVAGTRMCNSAPTANAGGPYSGTEGSAIAMSSASASDADNDVLSFAWTVDSALCSFDDATALNPKLTCTDDGVFTASLEVDDGTAPAVSSNATVTVANVSPEIAAVTGPSGPIAIGDQSAVNIGVTFTDPGSADTHTVTWSWGDSSGDDNAPGISGASLGHTYAEPGVYTVLVTVTDDDGGSDTEAFEFVVVYDPAGGFVTGGGRIESPAGAYKADESLSGKASFGFVAKYKKGANVPDGNTQFQFKAGDLNFHSTSYEWLVVAGNKAQFRGEGTVNGDADYTFMIRADDDNPDTFRIQIWGPGGGTVYDNGAQQPLDGGSIKVHQG